MSETPKNPETPKTTRDRDHASLSWVACYRDACQIHLSEKQGAFFPKAPKLRKDFQSAKVWFEEDQKKNLPSNEQTKDPERDVNKEA